MGYSINLYLDHAISEKSLKEIRVSKDKELIKATENDFEDKKLQIFLYLRFSGRTLKVYLDRKVTQKQWDVKGQEVNPRFYKDGAIDLNNYLKDIKSLTGKLFEKNTVEKIITTREQIKKVVDLVGNKDMLSSSCITFEKAFNEFIEDKKRKHSKSTISVYETTLKHLKEFALKTKTKLLFETINSEFESKLCKYFLDDLDMSNNTISKYIKTLKTFMNFCTEESEYNSKLSTGFRKFEVTESEKEVYALTIDELMKIYNYKFKELRLSQVRDVFCFLCFTGLRFSDVEKLKREDIKNDNLNLLIKKTKKNITIPLNDFAKALLGKYIDHSAPLPVISNQKTNDYLYEIGKLLDINEPVKKSVFKGPKVIEEYIPKYDVLTTHLGRKTFITNSLILGMNERDVKEFSGHKKEVNFRKYVAFADKQKTKVMNNVWNTENLSKEQIETK